MMGNSAREAFIRLLQEKEHWENYRKMLKCLCEEHKQDLTLGGSLLSETPAEDFPNLIWLNVELGFPDANKSDRMWPVAFKHQFQEEIEELHKPFFANTEEFSDTEELDGWEEATEGWLTPSKFMTSYRVEDVDYFVFLTDECTERASSLHEELRSLGARAITYYPDGDQLKVLFPDRKGRSHSLTEFQGCYRNGLNLKKFIKWLKGNHEIAQVEMEENVGIYIGYEHSIEDDARLYAAFRGKAAASEVKNACRLIDRIHEDPIRKVIRDSLKPDYRLEMFWRDTEEWFDNEYPHDWHDWD